MRDFAPYLQWIETQHDSMKSWLFHWCGINSGSRNPEGLDRMRAVLREALLPLGGEISLIPAAPALQVSSEGEVSELPVGGILRVLRRPRARTRVLLVCHLDTVFPPEHAFQKVTEPGDGTIHGPGVADAKGGIAVMIKALEAFERTPFAGALGWEILINSDEELGSPGSASVFAETARNHQVGLVFEPAMPDGSLVSSRKGSENYTVVIRGREAHAGRTPEAGRSAVNVLAELIPHLNAAASGLPGALVNVGVISGGTAVNVIPGLALARFNLRAVSMGDQRLLAQRVREAVDRFQDRDGISLELHRTSSRPPKEADEPMARLMHSAEDCADELGFSLQWRASGGVCDGNNLAASGLPTLDTMGVRGDHLHSALETMVSDSLVEKAKLSALLLMKTAVESVHRP